MKNEKWVDVIGAIDPNLVENAEKASANDVVSSSKTRRFTGFKRIAVIAVAVILTVGGLLMLNANVRAAVLGVFVSHRDGGWTVLSYADPETDYESSEHKTVYDVTVGYVPDGFIVKDIDVSLDPEYPLEEYRVIDLLDETAEDPYNNSPLFVRVKIMSSRLYEQKIRSAEPFEELYSPMTIRGMDAFVWNSYDYYMKALEENEEIARQYVQAGIEPSDFDGGNIIFGDSDVTVSVSGHGIRIDELIKIAENVVW